MAVPLGLQLLRRPSLLAAAAAAHGPLVLGHKPLPAVPPGVKDDGLYGVEDAVEGGQDDEEDAGAGVRPVAGGRPG